MDEVLGDDVVEVVLAALVPHMPDTAGEGDARAVVDGLELDRAVQALGNVAAGNARGGRGGLS